MSNPILEYKPGLTMDTPIAITMAATDWQILMSWFAGLPAETEQGVYHLVYGLISPQVAEALYTTASRQAADARVAERREQQDPFTMIRNMMGQGMQFPRPEDFLTETDGTDDE
jgi:hypothetical protein